MSIGLAAGLTAVALPVAPTRSAHAAYPTTDPSTCTAAASPVPERRQVVHSEEAAPFTTWLPTRESSRINSAVLSPRSTSPTSVRNGTESTGQHRARRSGITVRVFVHILRTPKGGGVTNARARQQVKILNNAYAGRQSNKAAVAPFVFRLADIDRTTNTGWYRMEEGTVAETHAKRALRRGDANDLNLYIGQNRSGSLGWGTQPGSYRRAPKLDGVVIRRSTMSGGNRGHYSSGDAAVHETGHWLGLLHTFAGRCGTRGDLVADTPREARPSFTCPVRRNTCSAPGRDPVHNFMDYSYDSCMNRFTHGQVSRMRQQWSAFRAGGG